MNKTPTNTAEKLMTTKELAYLLSVSHRHVERTDCAGALPRSVRIGRCKRWIRSEIETWLRSGCPSREAFVAKKGGA